MPYRRVVTSLLVLALAALTPGAAAAQAPGPSQVPPPDGPASGVRRLTVDDAVRLAVENNLGIQVTRLNPQIEDLNVAQAQSAWLPALTSTLQQGSTDSPNNSFLSGAEGTTLTNGRFSSNVSVQQSTRWGGTYSVGWDSSRTDHQQHLLEFLAAAQFVAVAALRAAADPWLPHRQPASAAAGQPQEP